MVWAVSKKGEITIALHLKGVKIDTNYYIQHVLKDHLLLHATKPLRRWFLLCQQDSAPSHKSKWTQEWWEEEMVRAACNSFYAFDGQGERIELLRKF